MNVTFKPILFDKGTARAIPRSFFSELFEGREAFPMHAGQSLNCALAFIRGPQQDIYTLTSLQCMRINFNERGFPATWHMSMLPLLSPCPLIPGNAPAPSETGARREPHFWFPDKQELHLINQALMEQFAPRTKPFILRARLHPTPSVLPPSIAPQYTKQLRAAH